VGRPLPEMEIRVVDPITAHDLFGKFKLPARS
jgi:hypothetical protein